MPRDIQSLCAECDGPGCLAGCRPGSVLNPLCWAAGLIKPEPRPALDKLFKEYDGKM